MTNSRRTSLSRFLIWSTQFTGKPYAFILVLAIFIIWAILGYFRGFTDEWLLWIDTLATVNASLMIIIIQSNQYRENKALHLKIEELIHLNQETEQELISIEERERKEFEQTLPDGIQKSV